MVINTGIGHCSSISHLTANGHHLLRVLSIGWPYREPPAQAMLLVLFDIWGCQLFKYLLIESGEYKHRSKLSHLKLGNNSAPDFGTRNIRTQIMHFTFRTPFEIPQILSILKHILPGLAQRQRQRLPDSLES
jgi:hypothetical protein